MLRQYQQGLAPDGEPFHCFRLTNRNGMCIDIMDWGATWLSCQVPVNGNLQEVLLGCKVQDYPEQQAYLGVTVGRYANRIANSRFRINGKTVYLNANQGKHQLHGGNGFDKRRWQIEKCGDNFVQFFLFSPDGDQGFTGNLQTRVTYRLMENNTVRIEFDALCDEDTPLNLTNHAYFNLDNATQGTDIRQHWLKINADQFLPVDQQGIPNAPLKAVQKTSFDFRQAKRIAQDFLQQEQHLTQGYDHAFLLNRTQASQSQPCAVLTSANQQLSLEVSTSHPALQVYTGNFLAGTPNRIGGCYQHYQGIALEPECLPDTPNHPEWYCYGGITKAHQRYQQWINYKFQCVRKK
ncbi:galactose-1-epimerase [Avibacterium paragallinarum]|uniref:Aldose 1-epimerase n=1 Tax=Avibacterium paragallinarum TaxID=728 RepID=A0A8B3TDY0_AVIPA|nr:galactose-1-epimerase [Avibacterium paragallinarum]RZN55327.1 galactose-1-epimerase [Avibacterium paragallinarum]